MKKTMRMLVSAVLCLVMLLSMTSCDLVSELISGFLEDEGQPDNGSDREYVNGGHTHSKQYPDGYTAGDGGDPCMFELYGFYWLETYDEVLEAIELLESHGSQIESRFGLTCDGEPYDIKWCFGFKWKYVDEFDETKTFYEHLAEGMSFFDRRIDGGYFTCYILRKDVTIEELNYSYLSLYDSFCLKTEDASVEIEDPELLAIDWWGRDEYGIDPYWEYDVMYADRKIATIQFKDMYTQDFLTDEDFEIFLDSLVLIG